MSLSKADWRLAGVLVLAACDAGISGPNLSPADHLTLQILPGYNWSRLPGDAAVISSASVQGHTLQLTVQYGGGCSTHDFALVAGGEVGESNPPFTFFRLAHNAHGDPCDAIVFRDLSVDLTPIIAMLQASSTALRFGLVEPGEHPSAIGELLLTF